MSMASLCKDLLHEPVMKTRAKSFPVAVDAAVFKSVSLREEDMVVPADVALAVIASSGFEMQL